MPGRTRVSVYLYTDKKAFLQHTTEESGQPGYLDCVPYLPTGAHVVSVAAWATPHTSMPEAFTVMIVWIEPEPPKHLMRIL